MYKSKISLIAIIPDKTPSSSRTDLPPDLQRMYSDAEQQLAEEQDRISNAFTRSNMGLTADEDKEVREELARLELELFKGVQRKKRKTRKRLKKRKTRKRKKKRRKRKTRRR